MVPTKGGTVTIELIEDKTAHPCRFQIKCTRCGFHWPTGGYVQLDTARRVFEQHLHACEQVLPTTCNCTEEGLPYCGRPECDIDWCWYCGDEYTEPCTRHAGVDHV